MRHTRFAAGIMRDRDAKQTGDTTTCRVDMNHFPKLLSSQIGFDVAQTMLEGFDRHYRVFRDAAITAKTLFEGPTGLRCNNSHASASRRTTIASTSA